MVTFFAGLVDAYPIVSIEDPLAEDDWEGWTAFTEALDERIQIVGDDLFVTDPERLDRGIEDDAATASEQKTLSPERHAKIGRLIANYRSWYSMYWEIRGEKERFPSS